MKKHEAIIQAYGEHFETVKDYIDGNGWYNYHQVYYFGNKKEKMVLDIVCGLETEKSADSKFIRPKSLKGIENNNGWIIIEENGLPNNGTKCHFIISGFEENEYTGYFEDGLFWDGKAAYTASIATHYQPIIKPEKPIY